MVRHLDLFSGIGGFAYAADQVWDNVEHIFCDSDPFCRQVLNKHWQGAKIYDDIKDITDTERKGWWQRPITQKGQTARLNNGIDLLTGGFPCQPFSQAGARRGTADERHLWPEMLRVIRLTQPTWVIAENVRGLLTWDNGIQYEQVCLDLEAAGYEVQPFIIPAVSVNAPHRRDRIWFVAHYTGERPNNRLNNRQERHLQEDQGLTKKNQSERNGRQRGTRTADTTTTNPRRKQRSEGNTQKPEWSHHKLGRYDWSTDWSTLAAELCGVDDGLSVELDGFKLTKAQNRKEQLKAYGNAIVPAVAAEIMRGMI